MTPPADPRFLQANERTFLAWMRTSLAIGAAGLGVAGLAPDTEPKWVRGLVSLCFTGFAVLLLTWALRRFNATDAVLREGGEPPRLEHASVVAVGLGFVLVVAVVSLLLTVKL